MNSIAEPVAASARVVPLTEAVEINPRPERGSVSNDLEVSFVPMAAVEAATGHMDTSVIRRYEEVKKGYTFFREGDVLFAKITPCMENGKIAVARGLRNRVGCGSTEFHVLRPRAGVDPHYVYHFVSSATYRAAAAHRMTGAVGQKRVPAAFLEQSEIPLPDLVEQRRIVAVLEKQFSRLDEAATNLKRAKTNLKRYKGSVLQSVTGDGFEVGEAVGASRSGSNNWRLVSIGDLASREPRSIQSGPFGSNLLHSEFQTNGKLVIGIDNVLDGEFSIGSNHRISDSKFAELERYRARPKDVLITVMATVGRVCVVPEAIEPAIITKHVYRISVDPSVAVPEYVGIALRGARDVRAQIRGSVRGQTRPGLNGTLIKRILVPIPPLAEQHRIVAEVDRRLTITREVEAEVDANLKRAHALRQATLARAFVA